MRRPPMPIPSWRQPARLLLLAAVALATAVGGWAADASERVIPVGARHTARIPASRARLHLVVEARGETAAAAQQAVTDPSQKVLAFLDRNHVEELQAGALILNPVHASSDPTSGASGDESRMLS